MVRVDGEWLVFVYGNVSAKYIILAWQCNSLISAAPAFSQPTSYGQKNSVYINPLFDAEGGLFGCFTGPAHTKNIEKNQTLGSAVVAWKCKKMEKL